MNRPAFIVAFSFLVLFSSCEKTYGIEMAPGGETTISIEVGQTTYSPQEQDVVMEAIQSRRQISRASLYDEVYSVSFTGNKTAHLRFDIFPLVTSEDSLFWKLNGIETGIPVHSKEEGGVILPALIPQNGVWWLDDYESTVPAAPYLEYAAATSDCHLTGLLEFQNQLYVYQSDGRISAFSIIKEGFYRVPEYWLNHLVEKERMAETAIAEAEGDCATFVFFTDAHWGKNMKKSPSIIRHIYEFTPFDDVIFGGDVITTRYTNLVAPMELGKDFQASFAFLGTRFHCLYGNHDNNSDSQPNKTEYHLSEEQVYSWLQSQMTDVVYGDYYNFYYDNPETKTRIICLDTGRYYYSQFRNKLPDTVRYAIEALTSVPNGWHVIMASHIWCTSKKQSDGTYIQYLDSYIKPVLKVFDDYNSRNTGTYTYNKQSVSYDFTGAKGSIEFCIGGHTHGDFTTASEGGIPVVIVGSDYFKTPEKGTTREQSVTMVVADYKNHRLKLFVVGRGSDRNVEL